MGFYQGHPVLELQENGQLSISVGKSFGRVFDALRNGDGQTMKIWLNCRIIGSFPDPDFNPIHVPISFSIYDDTCWVKERVRAEHHRQSHKPNAQECQHACRISPSCAGYQFSRIRSRGRWAHLCDFVTLNAKRHFVDVWKKVPDCSPTGTCVQVHAPSWLEKGTYCPVSYDVDRAGMTYLKEGKTAKETLYLRKFKTFGILYDAPEDRRSYSSVHNNDRGGALGGLVASQCMGTRGGGPLRFAARLSGLLMINEPGLRRYQGKAFQPSKVVHEQLAHRAALC